MLRPAPSPSFESVCRAALWTHAIAIALVAAGCSGAPVNPSSPAFIAPPVSPSPVVQRLEIVVRVDSRYAKVPGFNERLADRFGSVSDHMAARFGLPITVVRIERWATDPNVTDIEQLLVALEEVDDPMADLVFGITSAPAPLRPRVTDYAHSRYAGRHAVVRSLSARIPADDPEGLHRAEVTLILNALGRIFGALPACGPVIMTNAALNVHTLPQALVVHRWTPYNLALVGLHASIDLRRRTAAGPRVPKNVARRALAQLDDASSDVRRCAGRRFEPRRALLAALLEDIVPASPPPQLVVGPALGVDDAKRLSAAQRAIDEGRAADGLADCAEIATRAPASEAPRCAGIAAELVGDANAAVRHLRAYLTHHPGDGDVVMRLARILGRSGDDGAARALLEGFVAARPNHVPARLNLGIAYARLGKYAAAREMWQAVIDRSPDHADARALLSQLPTE